MKQISVFVENRVGSLRRLTKILKDNEINILSFSLSDTADYGMMRFLVDQPERALNVLQTVHLSASLVEVFAVFMKNVVGEMDRLLDSLQDVQIEYMYPGSTVRETACIICRVADGDEAKAARALTKAGFDFDGPGGTETMI